MGARYLIDTNVIIEFLGGSFSESSNLWLNNIIARNEHVLSVINQIELLGFVAKPEEAKVLAEFVGVSQVIPLTEGIVQQTIQLRKSHKIKLPDAIIAATAIQNDLQLLTRNLADFQKIKNLACVDVHSR
ncbi:MAG: type II toxin-antitoxin system VapC family toxin [Bacteroidota bacterium]